MSLQSQHLYTEVDLYIPGGKKVHYVRTSAGTSYGDAVFEPQGTPTALNGSKIQQESGGWHLRLRDGSDCIFPWYGPLREIRDRYYDPRTGRFISQDPSGQAGGTDLYPYALSSRPRTPTPPATTP